MFDLNTWTLLPHSAEYYSTVQIPLSYDANAACPRWEQFVSEVFEGDTERICLAQEWYGYSMTAETKAQKALVLYGGGGNGKGVFTTILGELIGHGHISAASLRELENQFVRATIQNKLVILSTENEFDKHFNTEWFKKITGQDRITASHKCKPPFEFLPISKIVMSVNKLPPVRDNSTGFLRRLCILHFSAQFSTNDNTADKNLVAKLRQELPGIFNWALEGYQRLKEQNFCFSSSRSADALLEDYQLQYNPFYDFVKSHVTEHPEVSKVKIKTSEVKKLFRIWAFCNKHPNCGKISPRIFWIRFEEAMRQCGMRKLKKSTSGNDRFCWNLSIAYVPPQIEEKRTGSIIDPMAETDLDEVFNALEDD